MKTLSRFCKQGKRFSAGLPSAKEVLFGAVLVLCCLPSVHANFLTDARSRLADGELDAAAGLFEKHLQTEPPSAAVYFELGQALEKTGKEADAALAFRRALLLAPRFAPAATALRESNAQLGIPSPARNWRNRVIEKISLDPLALAGAAIFWLGAFAILVGLAFSRSRLLVAGACCASAGIAACALVSVTDPRLLDAHQAIILADSGIALYKTPTDDPAEKITTLNQGSVVKILSARGRWFHGELPGGQRGWFLQQGTMPVIPPA
jgi:tetratricopeptide (TPR) repeat protein